MGSRPDFSIVPAWIDVETKRAVFDVTTVGGVAQLTIEMADPQLLRFGAVLPSGRTYKAEIEPELAVLALEASDEHELAGYLRTALAFVARCFKREMGG